jgi:hypothetical protein
MLRRVTPPDEPTSPSASSQPQPDAPKDAAVSAATDPAAAAGEPAPEGEPVAPAEPAVPSAWASADKLKMKRWGGVSDTTDPDARVVHAPLAPGIGTGRAFFFMFGFKRASEIDRKMLEMETSHIEDDVEVLRRAGYTVVVDRQATRDKFIAMVCGTAEGAAGLQPAGFYWSAHGHPNGAIECCDGDAIVPEEIEPLTKAAGMRVAIFGACYVGARSRTWKRALGGAPLVVGWGRPVTIDRAVSFLEPDPETETDLDDLIRRFLLVDAPLPSDHTERYSPVLEAVALGRLADLPARMSNVAEMLGCRWQQGERAIEVLVPLDDGRSQRAQVFVIDSTEPYAEGEPMLGVESDVGELSSLVDVATVLGGLPTANYAKVSLVRSETEEPRIVCQGFLPAARVRDKDLAALIYQVAHWGDMLERRIFGGDMR